jgi:hypothetical protein
VIKKGKGAPPLKKVERESQYAEIVAAALRLKPGEWIVVPVPETVRRVPALRKRKAASLSSLIYRQVRGRHPYRIVVSTREETGNLLILCKKWPSHGK